LAPARYAAGAFFCRLSWRSVTLLPETKHAGCWRSRRRRPRAARYTGSRPAASPGSLRAAPCADRPAGGEVLAVKLEQIESVEDHLMVIGAAMQLVEDREAIRVAPDRLAVDHRRPRGQHCYGFMDGRIALGPAQAEACEKTHLARPLAGDQAVSVMLDLVNPSGADRRLFGSGRNARLVSSRPSRWPTGMPQHTTKMASPLLHPGSSRMGRRGRELRRPTAFALDGVAPFAPLSPLLSL
jgi:hypothetical protein